MASQSLYRKWRSQTFADLVGQEAVVRTLKNALKSSSLAHAYLFTGPRGTGKTSVARLLAKTVNCLHPVDGEPCNQCQQCREITLGNSFNVIEIDAASNRGIDNIRELREKVMIPPAVGKYKVYILDEVHMLTTEACNALLKTLEEPPAYALFVMATTDVHKMLPTVLSRCQRFDFKRITTRQIIEHLDFIAGQEGVKLERGAAELIAKAAAGGMRDALSLLDQAIAYCGQEISLAQVQTMLGVADPRAIQTFILHVAQLDSSAGLHHIHELAEAGADLRQINTQVAEYWRALMLAKAGADVATILDYGEDRVREIVQTTQLFTLEEVTACARLFAQNDLAYKSQGTPQLALELALLAAIELHRHAQPSLAPSTSPVAAPAVAQPTHLRPAPVAETPRATVTAAPASSQAPVVASVLKPVETKTPQQAQASQSVKDSGAELPEWDEVMCIEDAEAGAPPVSEASVSTQSKIIDSFITAVSQTATQLVGDAASLTLEQVREKWEFVKKRVKTKRDGAKIAAVLNGYTIIAVEATAELPIVILKATAEFHYAALQKDDYHEAIAWALGIELEQRCRVRLVPPGHATPTTIPPPDPSTRSAYTTPPPAPRQSAFRERPVPDPSMQPREQPEASTAAGDRIASLGDTLAKELVAPENPAFDNVLPLARKNVVRENTSSTHETRQDVLRRKVTDDPVIQEVVRIFKAEIKEVHQK
jgi:DNA polymerase-3 subunit gamma/tau